MQLATLRNGLTVLAKDDGYPFTFSNRTQAYRRCAVLVEHGNKAHVWQGTGRPFFVVVTERAPMELRPFGVGL